MTTDTDNISKRPTHTVYTVREGRDGGKGYWMEVGAAWTNRDGSFSVTLDAVPVNGRLVIRERTERDQEAQQQQ